ncbi:MAG: ECF-type sigma factor [Pseudomonadota bacterium]
MKGQAPITQLLGEWQTGDKAVMTEIMPLVYDELHRVARRYMHRESSQHTLQATALINEAFCRLGNVETEIRDRGHFVGIVSMLMRQILVDHARAKATKKRGGEVNKVSLNDVQVGTRDPSVDVLALESVLEVLARTDPRKVRIAELYYFCGMTYDQTASALGISTSTLHRELAMLKALLLQKLSHGHP